MMTPVSLPITVAEWRRNAAEVFRVRLNEYKGTVVLDVRSWYRDAAGNLQPGKNGLTFALKHIHQLSAGLDGALMMARELGLLEDREAA